MPRSAPVDGFRLAYHRAGSGPAVILLAPELIDGRPDAVRAYLRHFWSHWSGPSFTLAEDDLDHLAGRYGPPAAFASAILERCRNEKEQP